ncbi:DNA-directed RNA polymerase subunit alpha [Mycoplasma iguanae]|uniref:DNA-directed RNA polymerase subunit alpha n=1 Tax=Mycoplasma iguanae TaxID=292461 RepID=A0ABY5RAM6_9MOLU|nr:DNA-directed RNA polymerase subunit alpha [Mycoplasma iguanae]UVD81802.1 DNA-directed RNA polymerase subunit alpha [Mycoplasma iguanae]
MKKMARITYKENKAKKNSEFSTTLEVQPLEKGFANTLGNALRRTLLSSVTSVAPFAVKISNVQHEFSTIPNVVEDVVTLISNIKEVKYLYDENVFPDEAILKCWFKSNETGQITARDMTCDAGIKMINQDQEIATVQAKNALEFEVFLISGKGYIDFEDNKSFINEVQTKLDSKIKQGAFIAVDSDFSPIKNVNYRSSELNSSAAIVQEKLELNIETDGTMTAPEALAQAAKILMAHLGKIANIENLDENEVFEQEKQKEGVPKVYSADITTLDLSIRSLNALRRAKYRKISDLQQLTIEELENIKNLGKKSVQEIVDKLEEQGIKLNKGDE